MHCFTFTVLNPFTVLNLLSCFPSPASPSQSDLIVLTNKNKLNAVVIGKYYMYVCNYVIVQTFCHCLVKSSRCVLQLCQFFFTFRISSGKSACTQFCSRTVDISASGQGCWDTRVTRSQQGLCVFFRLTFCVRFKCKTERHSHVFWLCRFNSLCLLVLNLHVAVYFLVSTTW